jgi:XTP/dITP diphosphohydrolase
MKLVVATQNFHKVDEMRPHFKDTKIDLITLKDIGFAQDIDEYGTSFRMNSMIKAQAIRETTKLPVFSDDSGVVVPALGGEPGVYSARYAGRGASDADNRKKLLMELKNKNLVNPAAYFVCVMTYLSDSHCFQVEGRCYGYIAELEKGENGFGYDPIFISENYTKHMAELASKIKNKISHRGRALHKLIAKLNSLKLI